MNRLFAATALLAGFPGSVSVGAAPALASAGQSKVALYFEANHGETDASVKFFTRAAGYNLYLTASQAVIVLPQEKADKTNGPVVVRMKLKGANVHPSVRGRNILPGHTSYFLGQDPAKWQAGVERYSKVEFKQVYPGIDMVYYGKQGHAEHHGDKITGHHIRKPRNRSF